MTQRRVNDHLEADADGTGIGTQFTVMGIDGCRSGWVVATATVSGSSLTIDSIAVANDLCGVVDEVANDRVAAVAIDMPIGLSAAGPRSCDQLARAQLGARRSSVFPAPVRAALDATDHADAVLRSRQACGVGLSIQAWNLVPKIVEVDRLLRSCSTEVRARFHETHPELAFSTLSGTPARHPKRTLAGRRERLAILHRYGARKFTAPTRTPKGAANDDVLDALVLAVRAGQWLGDGPGPVVLGNEVDSFGLRMEIRG